MTSKLAEIFSYEYRELRPRAPIPEFHIEFFPFSNINNTIRLRDSKVLVRVSDLLSGAPPDVLHAIAHILLAKLYRKEIETRHAARYRRYLGRRDVSSSTSRGPDRA